MPSVPRTYSAAEVAAEAACPEERIRWMTSIGLLSADEDGRFKFGSVLAVKMASALLDTGVPAGSIERAATEGLLSFQRTDEYLPYESGPRSERTFAEFQASAGPRAELLPAVYEVLGLPKPDPSAPIHRDEEELFGRFLDAWALAPEMFTWLSSRYLEHRSVSGIVEGFERFLASRGLAQIPDPPSPPAIAFVDLSGFTRLTRERGDESAVVAASSLQRLADATATRHDGRLVKLLGDGAMLRLRHPTTGVEAALDLVETMNG